MKKLLIGTTLLASMSCFAVDSRGVIEKGEYQVFCRSEISSLNSMLTAQAFSTVNGSHGSYITVTMIKPFEVLSITEMEYDKSNNSGGFCALVKKL